jgi:hypothetical protein
MVQQAIVESYHGGDQDIRAYPEIVR